mmetsp:Transcript_21193/g.45974  ORF Transcript_21193/g.45974 Transcript_21193/m.45974 type:complete len:220 (-) Transcript_21193:1856-2515(-)
MCSPTCVMNDWGSIPYDSSLSPSPLFPPPSCFHTGNADIPRNCRSGMAEHTSKTSDKQLFARRDVELSALGNSGGVSFLFAEPASRRSCTTDVGHFTPVPSSMYAGEGSHASLASMARIRTGASSSGTSLLSSNNAPSTMISFESILNRSLTVYSNERKLRLNMPAMRNISRAQLTCRSSNSGPLLFDALVERVPMAMASSAAWLEMSLSMELRVAGAL